MRSLWLFATALLTACATVAPPAEAGPNEGGPPRPTPVHGVTPGHKCNATGTDKFIGKPGTSETGAAIKRATKAAVLRWAPPGYMLTMDYSENRVTVYLDANRNVTKIACG